MFNANWYSHRAKRLRYVMPAVKFLDYSQTTKRKETGRHPKDIGDMTSTEIKKAVRHARFGAEALTVGLIT